MLSYWSIGMVVEMTVYRFESNLLLFQAQLYLERFIILDSIIYWLQLVISTLF